MHRIIRELNEVDPNFIISDPKLLEAARAEKLRELPEALSKLAVITSLWSPRLAKLMLNVSVEVELKHPPLKK